MPTSSGVACGTGGSVRGICKYPSTRPSTEPPTVYAYVDESSDIEVDVTFLSDAQVVALQAAIVSNRTIVSGDLIVRTDLSFRAQIDNSWQTDSFVTWLQLSTGQLHNFTFATNAQGSGCDHAHIVLSDTGTQLQCQRSGADDANCASACQGLDGLAASHSYSAWHEGYGEDALLVRAYLKPQSGWAHQGEWIRNKFTLSGSNH